MPFLQSRRRALVSRGRGMDQWLEMHGQSGTYVNLDPTSTWTFRISSGLDQFCLVDDDVLWRWE